MPLYQFFCRQCQREFEHELSMDQVGQITVSCPDCRNKARRIYSFQAKTDKIKVNNAPACATGSCPFVNK